MHWNLFKSEQHKKNYQVNQGRWYLKHPKNRPDFIFSPDRQLEDLWSQVCTLSLAKAVGIKVPEVFMVIPMHWERKVKDTKNHIRISASLLSKALVGFEELSTFYASLISTLQPDDLFEKPELFLSLLSDEQKKALGKLYATALWLGHWDLANNIDFANAGFQRCEKTGEINPVIVDGGNALDEGFHGYRKVETISLFARVDKENDVQHAQVDAFELRRFGYDHLSPLSDEVYPFLPRFLFNQKKLFWQDAKVVDGFVEQSKVISNLKRGDIKESIRQCWYRVVDADGLNRKQSASVLRHALKRTKSRWYPGQSNDNILDALINRGNSLRCITKKIESAKTKGCFDIDSILFEDFSNDPAMKC